MYGRYIYIFKHEGQVKTLSISPNAHTGVIGFTTGTVSVFDVRSGGILSTLKVLEGDVLKVTNQIITN